MYDIVDSLRAEGRIDSKKMVNIKVCLLMFFHTCVCCILVAQIFSIWLAQKIGLDALQIGEILALKTVVAIFYKPLFGYILDRFQLRRYLMIAIALLSLLAGPFLQFVYKPLLMTHNLTLFYTAGILGGIYFGFVVIAGGAAVYAYCTKYVEAHNQTMGKVASAYTAGWTVMGIISSFIYTYSPMVVFYVAGFMGILMFIVVLTLRIKEFDNIETKTTSKEKIKWKHVKVLAYNPRSYILLFLSITIMLAISAQFSQLGRYMLSFWPADKKDLGIQLDGFIKLPFHLIVIFVLAFASKLIEKINPTRTLVLMMCIFCTAFFLLGVAGTIHAHTSNYIYGVIAFNIAYDFLILCNPCMNLVILSYIYVSFDKKVSGTIFLAIAFMTNLFSSGSYVVIGGMFKNLGWATSYYYLGIFSLVCVIILVIALYFTNKMDRHRTMKHVKTS